MQFREAPVHMFQFTLLLAALFLEAFRTPGFQPHANVPKFAITPFLGVLQGFCRALISVDILL